MQYAEPKCEDGDTVQMILDLASAKGKLSFVVTSSSDGQTHSFVAADTIDVNKDYVMGVSLCDSSDSIQII